jgi:tRNA G18 (ribose-2'-O)-methylase SpoU
MTARGFCAIGIEHGKNVLNVGSLWRSADLLGAAFMFTIGRRYRRQASDTMKSWRSIPLFNFESLADLYAHLPYDTQLVGVELDGRARPLAGFLHPERAVYLLGSEDNGLGHDTLVRCGHIVQLPGRQSMNVSCAGSIVLYDRLAKQSA